VKGDEIHVRVGNGAGFIRSKGKFSRLEGADGDAGGKCDWLWRVPRTVVGKDRGPHLWNCYMNRADPIPGSEFSNHVGNSTHLTQLNVPRRGEFSLSNHGPNGLTASAGFGGESIGAMIPHIRQAPTR